MRANFVYSVTFSNILEYLLYISNTLFAVEFDEFPHILVSVRELLPLIRITKGPIDLLIR